MEAISNQGYTYTPAVQNKDGQTSPAVTPAETHAIKASETPALKMNTEDAQPKMLSAKMPTAKQTKSLMKVVEEWFEKWVKKPHKIDPDKIKDNIDTAMTVIQTVQNANDPKRNLDRPA